MDHSVRDVLVFCILVGTPILPMIHTQTLWDTWMLTQPTQGLSDADHWAVSGVNYTYSEPIVIENNSAFSQYGFPGNGTANDPYRIENYIFGGFGGVYIWSTSSHFVISNCIFRATTYGIDIYNASNGMIKDCVFTTYIAVNLIYSVEMNINHCLFTECGYGIQITLSHNSTVNACHFEDTKTTPITLSHMVSCTVVNNVIVDSRLGLALHSVSKMIVINNTFTHSGLILDQVDMDSSSFGHNRINGKRLGIFIDESNMIVNGNDYGQVFLNNCTGVTIVGGHFADVPQAIVCSSSREISIAKGDLSRCSVGIYLDYARDSTVNDYIIRNSSHGINVQSARGVAINNVSVETCSYTISVLDSARINMSSITIFDTTSGISIHDAEMAFLEGLNITNCASSGVYAEYCQMIQVEATVVCNSSDGIKFASSMHFSLADNRISDCGNAIYVDSSINGSIVNHSITNGKNGVTLSSSEYLQIEDSSILHNSKEGISLDNSSHVTIRNNVIANNSVGIFLSPNAHVNTIYGNIISMNRECDALDHGSSNVWDDGVGQGNAWGNYDGTGPYQVEGYAGNVDRYPQRADTDGDGLFDADEQTIYLTNPFDQDSDNDGWPDGYEVRVGWDPNEPNRDNGGPSIPFIAVICALMALVTLHLSSHKKQ